MSGDRRVRGCVLVAQSGWTIEESEFESRCGPQCLLLHIIQTGSEAHLASYPVGTGGTLPRSKAAGA